MTFEKGRTRFATNMSQSGIKSSRIIDLTQLESGLKTAEYIYPSEARIAIGISCSNKKSFSVTISVINISKYFNIYKL